MYKKILIQILFLISLFALSTCAQTAADTPGGILNTDIPGGILNVQISGASNSLANVLIVFDPDANVMSGNETIVHFPLSGYWSSPGNAALVRTWSSKGTDIEEGAYFVYAFLDLNNNGILDMGEDNDTTTFNIWDPVNTFFYNQKTGSIESRSSAMLRPNYFVDYFFAAELGFTLSYIYVA